MGRTKGHSLYDNNYFCSLKGVFIPKGNAIIDEKTGKPMCPLKNHGHILRSNPRDATSRKKRLEVKA